MVVHVTDATGTYDDNETVVNVFTYNKVYDGEYTDSIVKANANSNAILFVNYGEGGAETMFVLPGDATDLTTLGVTNVVIYNANKVDYTDLIVNADFEKNQEGWTVAATGRFFSSIWVERLLTTNSTVCNFPFFVSTFSKKRRRHSARTAV